jgi:hypothetical protein
MPHAWRALPDYVISVKVLQRMKEAWMVRHACAGQVPDDISY